jgi:mRNA interferase MazF
MGNRTSKPPRVGDIALAPFPYTDLTGAKRRPVLVVALGSGTDVIVAFITSQDQPRSPENIVLDPGDRGFKGTGLKARSTVRLERLVTVNTSVLIRHLGVVTPGTVVAVRQGLVSVFGLT